MSTLIDLIGQRFGKLVVIEKAQSDAMGRPKWLCRCDCGNTRVIDGRNLKYQKSCGCAGNRARKGKRKMQRHGLSRANKKLYKKWINMKVRTNHENIGCIDSYKKNNITVCDEWKNDFQAFYDWAMANGYSDNLTLDRIDNKGNFCPENCRWVDLETKNNNKSNTIFITYNNKTFSVAQWARELNIDKSLILKRLKCGYTIEQALAPTRKYNHCTK